MGTPPPVSPVLLNLFTFYVRRHLKRHFHAVRLSSTGYPPAALEGPLIVVLNHPSWWDPLTCLLLARSFFPDRTHYAPIEEESLRRYRFFRKIGFFGIETGTLRGAARFLRVGGAILRWPHTALWVTAEGRFTDAREQTIHLRPGVAHLIRDMEEGHLLPLALEYLFWDERCPEALARFGEPLSIRDHQGFRVEEWTTLLERKLRATQDALLTEAIRRDRAAFDLLLAGQDGVGGIYDAWRSFRGRLEGTPFRPSRGGG